MSAFTNIANYADHMYTVYHATHDGRYGSTPEEKAKLENLTREEFIADMVRTNQERWAPGGAAEQESLYAGSAERAKLSDTEITALANKYDPRSMDQEGYDALLDDLEDMGAISHREKGLLGYNGLTTAGYFGPDGNMVWYDNVLESMRPGQERINSLQQADGDVVKWMASRFEWKSKGLTYNDPAQTAESKRAADAFNALNEAMNSIVSRMAKARGGEAEDGGKTDIVEQILNPNSSFYEGMYTRMKLQLEQSEAEKEKQAIIDALDAILESLSAKKDDPKRPSTVRSMAELSKVADSLDKTDPRKEQLNLLRERLESLGIYADLDVGVKDNEKDETLTETLIREEMQDYDLSEII